MSVWLGDDYNRALIGLQTQSERATAQSPNLETRSLPYISLGKKYLIGDEAASAFNSDRFAVISRPSCFLHNPPRAKFGAFHNPPGSLLVDNANL